MGKAAENKKLKQEALLRTAFELFSSQGISNTSISDIAQKAGIAKGTFYLYFKNKYDLNDRLMRYETAKILQKAFDALSATGFTSLEDKIIFIAGHVLGQLTENRMLLRFINRNLSWAVLKRDVGNAPVSYGEENYEFMDLYYDMIRKSQCQYKNPEVMLYMIVELLGVTCYSSVINNDPLPIEQLRPYIMDSIRAIIRSQEITA